MKWKDNTGKLDRLISNLEKLDKQQVNVGFFNSTYGAENNNLFVAQVAQWQEEGVPANNIPPRPMFRTYLFAKVTASPYKIFNKMVLREICNGTLTAKKAYQSVGEKLVEDLKQIIQEGVPPANVAWWAAEKGNLPPLTHTGHMKDSVEYKIVNKIIGGS